MLEQTQQTKLTDFLERNKDTVYGKQFGYDNIKSIEEFQDRVPIVDYDALAPYIDRMAAGEENVLCNEPVRIFERSGGSTSANKLIPYTQTLLDEFSAATNAWLYDLYSKGNLLGTQSYWSVSPASQERTTTPGGTPIGFEDDTEYFSPVIRWALNQMLAVPGDVSRMHDVEEWRRETAIGLLTSTNLGFISVWSPTFLTILMDYISGNLNELLTYLPKKRSKYIKAQVQRSGRLIGELIWPNLQLISCWTDGYARQYIPQLRLWFPTVHIQSKGLLATEGVVSVPLYDRNNRDFRNLGDGSILAANSHFFEFLDMNNPAARPVLAHQLKNGGSYSPIMTTGNGFARYHLKDVVHCIGHHNELPIIRFSGKLDRTSDVCGEKLSASHVTNIVERLTPKLSRPLDFVLLAPSKGSPPHYEIYLESEAHDEELNRFTSSFEDELLGGYHYKYCRDLGQLGPLKMRRVSHGWRQYQDTLVNAGQKAGDIKPTYLDSKMIWAQIYQTAHQ